MMLLGRILFLMVLAGSVLCGRPGLCQQWLTDKSLLSGSGVQTTGQTNVSPNVLPGGSEVLPASTNQSASSAAIPTVPEGALLEPPPPLVAENVPSVFDSQPTREEILTNAEGPIWYNPMTWIPWDGWVNSAELGINGSTGNAESFSFQTGARFKRKTDINLMDLRLTHNRTSAAGNETQNNAILYADFERFFGDSPWTAFLKNGVEYDEFKAFDLRYNINAGVGYRFYNTKDLQLKGRFGAGTSREFGGPDNRWVPEALFGADYEHQINKRNKLIAKIDYFPEWTDFDNFRLISDLAWEILLDESGNMSLKLGALDRYDSTPNGRKPNDLNYTALLLYKF